jgi:prepilin-type N-terminal cleavage/methylation domain-containing protein
LEEIKVKRVSNGKGFTLLELIIGVIVVGVISALVVTRFTNAAREVRVKTTLTKIYLKQQDYQASNGTYWISGGTVASSSNRRAFSPIDVEIDTSDIYVYHFKYEGVSSFVCEAIDSTNADTWVVDQKGVLAHFLKK